MLGERFRDRLLREGSGRSCEWGYCLWDKARLNAWGLFAKGWTAQRAHERAQERSRKVSKQSDRLNKLWEERSRIWQLGGKGWWAEGDESKIVWTCGTATEQQKRAEVKERARGCRVHGPSDYMGRDNQVCPPGCLAREGERIRVGTSKVVGTCT